LTPYENMCRLIKGAGLAIPSLLRKIQILIPRTSLRFWSIGRSLRNDAPSRNDFLEFALKCVFTLVTSKLTSGFYKPLVFFLVVEELCVVSWRTQAVTVKVGTVFEDSHAPMRLWLQAMYLLCSSKKGISSRQLHRTLGVTIKTAWFGSWHTAFVRPCAWSVFSRWVALARSAG
jgi:hypothetical protein